MTEQVRKALYWATIIAAIFAFGIVAGRATAQISRGTIKQAQRKALASKTKYQLALIPHVVNGAVIASVDSTTLEDYRLIAVNDSLRVDGLKVARENIRK